MHDRSTPSPAEQLSIGLGWFSVALGVAELTAPRAIASIAGVPSSPGTQRTIRCVGARELATGLAILSSPDRPGALWLRLAGDAIDMAALGTALASRNGRPIRTVVAAAAVLGVAAADWWSATELTTERRERGPRGISVQAAVTVGRPIREVYRFWRDFENFPQFMRRLESVTVLDDTRSHWKMSGPGGVTIEWDADIVSDQPDHMISWRSAEDASVWHRGAVRFEAAPAGRGTEIHVEMRYEPPGGYAGRAVAWLAGRDPQGQIREDLRRIKQILELGEVVLSDGPGISLAAQPPSSVERAKETMGVGR